MAKRKTLPGKDVIRIFTGFDFHEFPQKGSHIKLPRTLPSGHHQSLTIVNQAESTASPARDL
jgi:predicted RNA binding protein YcfA (HicA-like mRNA interferase family)